MKQLKRYTFAPKTFPTTGVYPDNVFGTKDRIAYAYAANFVWYKTEEAFGIDCRVVDGHAFDWFNAFTTMEHDALFVELHGEARITRAAHPLAVMDGSDIGKDEVSDFARFLHNNDLHAYLSRPEGFPGNLLPQVLTISTRAPGEHYKPTTNMPMYFSRDGTFPPVTLPSGFQISKQS